jgi:hypothetical protein
MNEEGAAVSQLHAGHSSLLIFTLFEGETLWLNQEN